MSFSSSGQSQRILLLLGAGILAGLVAYRIGTTAPVRSNHPHHQRPTEDPYTPAGDPAAWSDADMARFLTTRDIDIGHDATRTELLAMVESKLHEPRTQV